MNMTIVNKEAVLDQYLYTRYLTEKITERLETEDFVVQAMSDVSPP
ncbi:hypothetical protein [Alteribacillus sp. YIM 98480]|nr:hypothetical protein [Alteribacillus sp. YIM 98480]